MTRGTESEAPGVVSRRKRIFLIDEHPIVHEAIRGVFEQHGGLCLCSTAYGKYAAIEGIRTTAPDMVILGLEFCDNDGLQLLHEIKAFMPDLPVLVFSRLDETLYAEECLGAGANGYLMKTADRHSLLLAVQTILRGKVFLSEAVKERVLQGTAKSRGNALHTVESLSVREKEIFSLLGEGQDTREIGEMLGIKVKTVASHINHIKDKLLLSGHEELLVRALRYARRRGGKS